ncbi:MAG: glycosyltransferase family 39 protein [Planctomycetes bacterium]|nr:glycosyltransferase family 39 protein [Planctomycetota bacterium]
MMEAMAAGLPAIVPPVGDLPDLVSDGKTGLLIDPQDAHHSAERIAALLDHSDYLDQLAQNARSKATAHASVSNVAARWSRFLSAMPVDSSAPIPGTARTALGIFAVALVVRLLFCFSAVPLLQLKTGPSQADFFTSTDGYMNIAKTLVDHGKYAFAAEAPPTSYRAPMFPFAIASGYALLRDVGVSVLVVNCLASALTCVLVYFIAVRLVGSRAGLALMIPAIFLPLSIYYCASSFSDTFFALAIALYLLTLLRLMQSPNRRSGLLHGIAIAFAALTKAVALPLPLVVGTYALLRRPSAIRPLVISLMIGFAGIGIWTARNYASTGRFVLVTGGSGYNALIGNFMIDEWTDCDTALAHGRRLAQARVQEEQGSVINTRDLRPTGFLDVPPDIDQLYGRSAMQMMLDSPQLLMRKLAINSVRFWYFSSSKAKSLANGLVNGLILLFALAALPELLRTRRPETEVIGLVAITFVVLYSLIIVHSSRFCLPMVMVLTPMASVGFARLLRLILSERPVNSLLQRA